MKWLFYDREVTIVEPLVGDQPKCKMQRLSGRLVEVVFDKNWTGGGAEVSSEERSRHFYFIACNA